MATTYEVRFQTVDPNRRAEYIKMYKQAIQEIKLAGCRGGLILCSENDPGSVLVLLEWESKEHHLSLARHAASHALSRRRRRLAKQAQYGRLLPRRDDLKIAKVR
jgi:hypothetical protein